MNLLLEKLSQYWQIRLLAVVAGVGLIAYAVVLPARTDSGYDPAIQTVSASRLAPETALQPEAAAEVKPVLERQNPSAAMPWLGENREAADQLMQAASAYDGERLPRDFNDSIRALRRDAGRGNVTAEFLLGHAYEDGFGVPRDLGEMARWYALAGQGVAAHDGDSGPGGSAVPKDVSQAIEIYRRAAENGDPAAELYLGFLADLNGDTRGGDMRGDPYGGESRGAVEAARWYRKAALHGSASAACDLGVLYHDGDGLPRDSVEAAQWFSRAAAQGSAVAQYGLGKMYAQGDGVSRNPEMAAQWLEKAARQGNARAQVLLSAMYAKGEGVAGSTPTAYMWINLASGQEPRARDSRDEIEKLIQPAEIAEGQRMTHAWLMRYGKANR